MTTGGSNGQHIIPSAIRNFTLPQWPLAWWLEGGWKSEIRNPKSEGNPKSEIRNPKLTRAGRATLRRSRVPIGAPTFLSASPCLPGPCRQWHPAWWLEGGRKSEIRNPKSEGNPKSEIRNPKLTRAGRATLRRSRVPTGAPTFLSASPCLPGPSRQECRRSGSGRAMLGFRPSYGVARRSRNQSGAPVCNRLWTTHRAKPVANRRSNPLEKSSRRTPILWDSTVVAHRQWSKNGILHERS